MSNNTSVLKVKEFFSDNEYIEINEIIKVSKEVTIFSLNQRGDSKIHFIATSLLKFLNQEDKRIDLSSVIDNYGHIEYDGKLYQIYPFDNPEFQNTLLEVYCENI